MQTHTILPLHACTVTHHPPCACMQGCIAPSPCMHSLIHTLLTLVMMSGSPCSSPPFSVKPHGAPPLSWTWMWWKDTSCSTVSISFPPPRPQSLPRPVSLPSGPACSYLAPLPRRLHHEQTGNGWRDGGVRGKGWERGRETEVWGKESSWGRLEPKWRTRLPVKGGKDPTNKVLFALYTTLLTLFISSNNAEFICACVARIMPDKNKRFLLFFYF